MKILQQGNAFKKDVFAYLRVSHSQAQRRRGHGEEVVHLGACPRGNHDRAKARNNLA